MNIQADDLYAEEKDAILAKALIEADFDGWSVPSLRRAADAAGISRDLQRLAFPRGVIDIITYYSHTADALMLEMLEGTDLDALKIRERITLAVRMRLSALEGHKPAAKRALGFLSLPPFAPEAMGLIYNTVDAMWRAVGDTSTDFNFYSKRATLAGVYSTTLLRFLEDTSPDHEEAWGFLDRRINDVMKIEKAKGSLLGSFDKIPSPLSVLARLRYPEDRSR